MQRREGKERPQVSTSHRHSLRMKTMGALLIPVLLLCHLVCLQGELAGRHQQTHPVLYEVTAVSCVDSPQVCLMEQCTDDDKSGAGQPVQDCCLQTSPKRIPFGAIAGYEIQSKDKGCPIDAVVFETNSNPSRKLCATPTISWVKKSIKKLDKRKKETEKSENKPKKSAKRQLE